MLALFRRRRRPAPTASPALYHPGVWAANTYSRRQDRYRHTPQWRRTRCR